jgi:hypothetical protein
MKFCVMMTAEGDAVVHVEAALGKERHRQDMVGLQMIPPLATSAGTVARPHALGAFFAASTLPERLLGAAIPVVGVVLAGVQPREESGLRLATFTRPRTIGAVAVPVLTGLMDAPAHFARKPAGPRIRQRLVDGVQKALVAADCSDVPAKVFAGLEVGTEGATRFRHHLRIRSLAWPAAEHPLGGVFVAPGAVLFDHERTLPKSENSSP